MNPNNNPERRKLRARAHEKRIRYLHETDHDRYFGDASHQVTHGKIAFVNTRTKIHYSETFTEPPTIDDLEEYAIAKAMEHAAQQPNTNPTLIFTDSQRALRNYTDNTLHFMTDNLVREIHVRYPDTKFRLVWTPGHQGVEGNETAHRLTRENSPGPVTSWPAIYSEGSTGNAHRALRKSRLKEQREERTIYPQPPKTMSRQQSSLVRKAQTNSLSSHHIFHHIYIRPDSPTCPKCGEYPSIPHTYWSCNPPTLPQPSHTSFLGRNGWLHPRAPTSPPH
ncbi:hypothetical protein HPB47_012286 [Ixodes persulcatus]|uniref:Uncharacterized protein n=1 Tax=Ixodes persulcatus TaxID=34615 RepID=A0AC60NTW4_IXOPE|nr:hypothetical protein HPB47_012286 [Ixodes persulcatus]